MIEQQGEQQQQGEEEKEWGSAAEHREAGRERRQEGRAVSPSLRGPVMQNCCQSSGDEEAGPHD